MIKRKSLRNKGKIKLSKYFQDIEIGERVSVISELGLQPKFPSKLQGRTGIVESRRGNSYIIRIKDLNKEKTYIIHPVHLRKIKK
ncbi:MAG: 50S ribosomal protein L21e [Candidatus Nanoarchaeia archaeon]|nr:50S ribosomal protein L21e [Candidatus Nanoarchaeia archaeon]MDD5741328.1 50S ribosomal protein L21e [Candidatus Nanoarchaeia archaeon]